MRVRLFGCCSVSSCDVRMLFGAWLGRSSRMACAGGKQKRIQLQRCRIMIDDAAPANRMDVFSDSQLAVKAMKDEVMGTYTDPEPLCAGCTCATCICTAMYSCACSAGVRAPMAPARKGCLVAEDVCTNKCTQRGTKTKFDSVGPGDMYAHRS